MKAVVAYIPVLHEGYLEFLRSQVDLKFIFVIDSRLALELEPNLRKDIRAMHSTDAVKMLSTMFSESCGVYSVMTGDYLANVDTIVMPDEDISRAFAIRFLNGREVHYESVFLRWDRTNSTRQDEVAEDIAISSDTFDKRVMHECAVESTKSSDWWRQVGGCIVKNGSVLMPPIHNEHVPSPNRPYYDGDPRIYSRRGEGIERGTAMHVELSLIARAAEIGMSLSGSGLYVTTFPCPWCAKAIAYSGISKVYFEEGYSVLDAQRILSENDVELIRITK
jgi:dCMP deaminase